MRKTFFEKRCQLNVLLSSFSFSASKSSNVASKSSTEYIIGAAGAAGAAVASAV